MTIAASEIRIIEECGDSLKVTFKDGKQEEYDFVAATRWTNKPPLDYWLALSDEGKRDPDRYRDEKMEEATNG